MGAIKPVNVHLMLEINVLSTVPKTCVYSYGKFANNHRMRVRSVASDQRKYNVMVLLNLIKYISEFVHIACTYYFILFVCNLL